MTLALRSRRLLKIGCSSLCLLVFPKSGLATNSVPAPNAYSAPASFPFIQQVSGDTVISLQDTSGSISAIQDKINAVRSSNPDQFLVIYLRAGATYIVTTTPLVLGSKMCLLGGGATFSANANSTASSLIRITPGSSFVSITQSTLQGGSANLYGILGAGVSRVHLDQVIVSQTGRDGIYLQGMGSTNFDNEITIARCEASLVTSSDFAGVHLVDVTQAVCVDTTANNNSTGILLESSAHCVLYNNQANFNSAIGINLSDSMYCKTVSNRCFNNATGLAVLGSKVTNQYNVFVGNEIQGTSTGFLLGGSVGSSNILYQNKISSNLSTPISTTGTGIQRICSTDAAYTLSSTQEYFYPPTISNQHGDRLICGRNRTDVTSSATTLSDVKIVYDEACKANPTNFIVLHLTAPQITGDSPINLNSYTSVILDGTINLNQGIAAFISSNSSRICLSGGVINGGNTTGRSGLFFSNCSRIIIENMSLNNFGDKNTRVANSDVIAFVSCQTPCIVMGCTLNGGAARGIWTKGGNGYILTDNSSANMNMDGIDIDAYTANALVQFNTTMGNLRYGLFVEEAAKYNQLIGNYSVSNSMGINVYASVVGPTSYNSFIGNTCQANPRGLRVGGAKEYETNSMTGLVITTTNSSEHNFFFNNTVLQTPASTNTNDAAVCAQLSGSENYFSQNSLLENATNYSQTDSAVFFNPPSSSSSSVLNYADWQSSYFWYGKDSSLAADPNTNGASNLLEYALVQNPLEVASASSFPFAAYDSTTLNGPWLALTYRHNNFATDLTYEVWSSSDLTSWSLLSVDGVNAITQTYNSDVDGNGSVDLLRTRVKLGPNDKKRFLRLKIRKN